MKKYFTGFFMSWGMFTAIPCPLKIWDEEARGEMLACFPLTGAVVGILWALIVFLTKGMPQFVRAFLIAVIPWLLTGFMHLDGFMDVCDAILSRRDLETRQKILKDSRVGAFSVICVGLLIAANVCICADIFSKASEGKDFGSLFGLLSFLLIPVASRATASLCIMQMKPMGTSQYSGRTYAKKLMVLPAVLLLVSVFLPFLLSGGNLTPGFFSPAMTAVVYLISASMAGKNLDGMNGDISGFAQTLSEIAGLIVLIF